MSELERLADRINEDVKETDTLNIGGIEDILGDMDLDELQLDLDDDFLEEDKSIKIVTGSERENVEKSEQSVNNIIAYINDKIQIYNCMVEGLNELEKTRYNSITHHNTEIELEQTLRSGGGINTRENCNKLEQLIAELKNQNLTVTVQSITTRLHFLNEEMLRDLWDMYIEYGSTRSEGSVQFHTELEGELRENTIKELIKILGIIKPTVETIEKSLHYNDTAKSNTLERLGRLNQKMKPIKDIDAFYVVDEILEISDGNSTISETRDYLEVRAKLARITDDNLTRKDAKKYKEYITIRVPSITEGATMELITIINATARGIYEEKCKELDIQATNYILKPFVLTYINALITFGEVGDFDAFIENAKLPLDSLRSARGGGRDLTLSITADKTNLEGLYDYKYKTNSTEFTRYTEREILKILEDKQAWKALREYVEIPHTTGEERADLHKYDTPCRRFLLGVLKEYPFQKEIDKTFHANKVEILREYLPIAIPYLVTHAKNLKNRLPEDGLNLNYSVASDLVSYGEPLLGFTMKYMRNKEEGTVLSLQELLKDESILNGVKFKDILGTNKKYYGDSPYKKVPYSPTRPSEFATLILESIEFLSRLNIDLDLSIEGKGKSKVQNNVLLINSIRTEDDHLNYLRSIVRTISNKKGLPSDINLDLVVNTYRERITPMKEIVPIENVYYIHQQEGLPVDINATDLNYGDFEDYIGKLNLDRIVISDVNEATTVLINGLNSDVLKDILNNNTLQRVDFENTKFLDDLSEVLYIIPLLKNASEVVEFYLSNINESVIKNYKTGTLQELIGLPGPNQTYPSKENSYDLSEMKQVSSYDAMELIKGYNRREFPVTLVRDIIFLDKILSNEKVQERLKGSNERMTARTISNTMDSLLSYSNLPVIKVDKWDTAVLSRTVEQILKNICPSNVEYALIRASVVMKLFYQNANTAKNLIESQLKDYFIEYNEYFDKLVQYQNLIYWLDAVQVLPIEIYAQVKEDRDLLIKQYKNTLKVRPSMVESPKELDMKRKRNNAYYKLFLDNSDPKYLKDVDRNYVDFELLTSKPRANGMSGGEYSISELITQYGLEDEVDYGKIMNGTAYVDVILLVEQKYPKIKDELPQPIIEFIEKDNTISVLDPTIIEELRKDTSFNLNYKSF